MKVSTTKMSRLTLLTVTFLAAVFSITACEQVRKVTYPPDFHYMEDKEVKQIMQQMGENMGKLARLVDENSLSEKDKQKQVIDVLNKLDGYATKLSGGQKQTNQFVIAEHIHGFSGDLVNAKMLASLDPPRYDKARNIVNSCSKCHEYR